jgi:hypothetical protein
MAPLGLGSGFYGLGPTINSDNTTVVVAATGTAVRVTGEAGTAGDEGVVACNASVLQSTFQGSFTIAFWVKMVDGITGGARYLCGTLGDGTNGQCAIYITTDGKIQFNFMGDNSDTHYKRTASAVFADGANAYKHIAIKLTKSSGNSTSVFYIDGTAVSASIVGGAQITEANHAAWDDGGDVFAIGSLGASLGGGSSNVTAQGVSADIAEFAIWNVALEAQAIAAIAGFGVPTASNFPDLTTASGDYPSVGSSASISNLIAYWKCNDYSGIYANNSITGISGKLLGASVFV